jgi:carboxymethylenebutenolidase
MTEREIHVPTSDGEMTTFIVHPDGEGPWPVAVVYMDAIGYREQLKQNARFALEAASALGDEFVAVAGIHPGALVTDQPDSPHHALAGVRGELYFAFAENDRSATPEIVDRFRDELERAGVSGVVERVPGTAHGFAMADQPAYHPDAAERHFERTLELWRRNLEQQVVR